MEVEKKNDSNHSSSHTAELEIIFEAKIIRDERNDNVIIYIYINHREKYLEKSLYIHSL